jgi:hypothetical protein
MAVDTVMNYFVHDGRRPILYTSTPPAGAKPVVPEYAKHPVRIEDARSFSTPASLDAEGCALVEHDTSVADFFDSEEVERVYYPEAEELVAGATGAFRVVAFDHNQRSGAREKQKELGVPGPIKAAHNDYTHASGPKRVRELLEPEDAEAMLEHRFAVINVWRPIEGPIQRSPLAVCDARSIPDGDLVETELRYADRVGLVSLLKHHPGHRWFYFPEMRKREVMLIKCYDSETDGRARFTAHSAFDDPTSPADAAPRESIEVRTLAFFP